MNQGKQLFEFETVEEPQTKEETMCQRCGLYLTCKTPKIQPVGKGGLGIVILVDAPTPQKNGEDKLIGDEEYSFIRGALSQKGISITEDCTIMSVVQCALKPGSKIAAKHKSNCWPRTSQILRDLKPSLVFAMGGVAINTLSSHYGAGLDPTSTHGRTIPNYDPGCWIACGNTVDYYTRFGGKNSFLLGSVIDAGVKKLTNGFECPDIRLDETQYTLVETMDGVRKIMSEITNASYEVAFDIETTGLSPYMGHDILTFAVAISDTDGFCIGLHHKDTKWTDSNKQEIERLLVKFLLSKTPKIIQNFMFENIWANAKFGITIKNCVCDTMIREHILDNRQHVTGQKFQCFVRYGSAYGNTVNQANLANTPLCDVALYNVLDCRYMLRWKRDQDDEMNDRFEMAYQLFHNSMIPFTNMEHRGIKIDSGVLRKLEKDTEKRLKEIDDAEKRLRESGGMDTKSNFLKRFKIKYGKEFNRNSTKQNQELFFDIIGIKPTKLTTGAKNAGRGLDSIYNCATDNEVMQEILNNEDEGTDLHKFVEGCLEKAELTKLLGTYIKGILPLIGEDGYLHPSFLLHSVSTYRSSSEKPNFQNLPVRKKIASEMRRAFVPRNDLFLEVDFGANEVRYIATMSGDRNLIRDINNGVNFHRYFASLLFEKPESEITDEEYYQAKNGFVFPCFYGSYHVTIAKNYPEWKKSHVKKVEDKLWLRFRGVKEWQDRLTREYTRKGCIETSLGFRFVWGKGAPMSRNNQYNSPVQGTAFHRLLWAIQKIDRMFIRLGLRSVIVGQIHDSIVVDLAENEKLLVIKIIEKYMKCQAWEWDNIVSKETEYKIGKNLKDMSELRL